MSDQRPHNEENFGALIRSAAAAHPDRPALVLGDSVHTYAELDAESSRVARALLAAGVEPKDRVAFLDKNMPEYFALLFGAAKLNAVTVAVNWRLAPPEIAYILNHSGAKVLIVGEEFAQQLDGVGLEIDPKIVVLGNSEQHQTYEEWISPHEPVDPHAPIEPSDTCYQLYTSGTTGLPKGVELSNANLFALLRQASASWSFDDESVSLAVLPVFHIAGTGFVMVCLYAGATSILARDVDPAALLAAIPEKRVTNIFLVPAILQFVLASPEARSTDFSSLRMIGYGGAPISEDILKKAIDVMGPQFVQVYGMTECPLVSQLNSIDHDPGGPRAHLLRSTGRVADETTVRFVDGAGNDVADGTVGEIWVRSPMTLVRYFGNPQATEAAYPEGRDENGLGWFRTGDAGYLQDGYLYIHDRVKDMIISGGENVYPAEVENALMSHPEVADVAVIGVPDDKWGETVKAVVVSVPDASASDQDLIDYCRERLARYKCPTSIDRSTELPRTASGKVVKHQLRSPYWDRHERMVH